MNDQTALKMRLNSSADVNKKGASEKDAGDVDAVTKLKGFIAFQNELCSVRTKDGLLKTFIDTVNDSFNCDGLVLQVSRDKGNCQYAYVHHLKSAPAFGNSTQAQCSDLPLQDGFFDLVISSRKAVMFELADLGIKDSRLPHYLSAYIDKQIHYAVGIPVECRTYKFVLFVLCKKGNLITQTRVQYLQELFPVLALACAGLIEAEQFQQVNEMKSKGGNNKLSEGDTNIRQPAVKIIGEGEAIKKTIFLAMQVAPSESTVLLLGETGTGKEVIANLIHENSSRNTQLMVKINCAALPHNLIESELFGHERGSFTGANELRIGKFETAHLGTLFLDEIGELPLELQAKLLRVLQEKEFERIGGRRVLKTNARIIAATSRNLRKEVEAGRFRGDLFYRLNIFPLTLPPLRERKEDIPALASYFTSKFAERCSKKVLQLSNHALNTLLAYTWPGNIRELEHVIERSVLLSSGTRIKQISLSGDKQNLIEKSKDLHIKTLAEVEREHILKAISRCNGRISGPNGVAVKLGLPSTTLISKMQKLGIKKSIS